MELESPSTDVPPARSKILVVDGRSGSANATKSSSLDQSSGSFVKTSVSRITRGSDNVMVSKTWSCRRPRASLVHHERCRAAGLTSGRPIPPRTAAGTLSSSGRITVPTTSLKSQANRTGDDWLVCACVWMNAETAVSTAGSSVGEAAGEFASGRRAAAKASPTRRPAAAIPARARTRTKELTRARSMGSPYSLPMAIVRLRSSDLKQALAAGALSLHYQPQVHIKTGKLAGVEAFVRWPHPVHGMIGPGEIIRVVEEARLHVEFDRWVVGAICRQAKKWRAEGVPVPVVAATVWSETLRRPDALRLIDALAETGVDPKMIEIECPRGSTVDPDLTRALVKIHSPGRRRASEEYANVAQSSAQLNF